MIKLDFEEETVDDPSIPVIADLEKRSPLKVILHLDVEMVEDEKSLKTGDTIWMIFSERPYYIEGSLPYNSIEEIIDWVSSKLTDKYHHSTLPPIEKTKNLVIEKNDQTSSTGGLNKIDLEAIVSYLLLDYSKCHEQTPS